MEVKFIQTESRMVASRVWRGGRDETLLPNGYRVSVWEDEKVLGWMMVTSAQREWTSHHWSIHLKNELDNNFDIMCISLQLIIN